MPRNAAGHQITSEFRADRLFRQWCRGSSRLGQGRHRADLEALFTTRVVAGGRVPMIRPAGASALPPTRRSKARQCQRPPPPPARAVTLRRPRLRPAPKPSPDRVDRAQIGQRRRKPSICSSGGYRCAATSSGCLGAPGMTVPDVSSLVGSRSEASRHILAANPGRRRPGPASRGRGAAMSSGTGPSQRRSGQYS